MFSGADSGDQVKTELKADPVCLSFCLLGSADAAGCAIFDITVAILIFEPNIYVEIQECSDWCGRAPVDSTGGLPEPLGYMFDTHATGLSGCDQGND